MIYMDSCCLMDNAVNQTLRNASAMVAFIQGYSFFLSTVSASTMMRFRDFITLRLLDPSTQVAVFNDNSAELFIRASYFADNFMLAPPFAAQPDSVEPGLGFRLSVAAEAQVTVPNIMTPVTARLVSDLQASSDLAVDAVWQGHVTAGGIMVAARVDAIAGDLSRGESLTLHLEPEPQAGAAGLVLPVVAAILIDDPDDPRRDLPYLLGRVRAVRDAVAASGRSATGPAVRHGVLVVIILPEDRLDDAIWPGAAPAATPAAARTARLAAANGWANPLGIVFATNPRPA